MFTDIATIKVQAGKGGNGYLSFHSSRGNPRGGPDGGDGGRGGDIIVQASHNTNTLTKYRTSRLWKAQEGSAGFTNRRHGKNGESVVLTVPPGTVVREGNDIVADLILDGQQAVVATGGDGGFGNWHFKSSIRQAPKMAELGEPGESKELTLELKLVADVGLVGLPNAGKSTLLSMVSNAKPEIASYAFTTLVPNLGVVDVDDTSFLLADIPGLIEGASKGKGLGDEFLRHVERCRVLLHLIDVNSADIVRDYKTIRAELKNYAVDLSNTPFMVVLTKSETKPAAEVAKIRETLIAKAHVSPDDVKVISAVTTTGLVDLMRSANKMLQKARRDHAATVELNQEDEMPTIELSDALGWQVTKVGKKYHVSGEEIERFVRRTNFDQSDGVRRLREILRKKGVFKAAAKLGAQKGDTFVIIGKELAW